MLEPEAPTFDFDALLNDISVATKDDERKFQLRRKNCFIIKQLVESSSNVQKAKRAQFIKYSELKKDFTKLSNDHQQLLEKHIPMIKEFDVTSSRLVQLEADNKKLEIALDALRSHFIQMQAYSKKLELEKETITIEKNLAPQKSQTKLLKHVILFGKLAANKGKFSKKHDKLLKKYLKEAGEDEETLASEDKELDSTEILEEAHNCDDKKQDTREMHKEVHNCNDKELNITEMHKGIHSIDDKELDTVDMHEKAHDCNGKEVDITEMHKEVRFIDDKELDTIEMHEEAHDCDDKELDTIDMPHSCSSVDTGVGSSLMSEDEGWSPRVQFTHSSTYAVSPSNANESCDTDFIETIVEEVTSSKLDTETGHEKPLQSLQSTLANSTSLETTEMVGSSSKVDWTVDPKTGKNVLERTITMTKGDINIGLVRAYSISEALTKFESSAVTGETEKLSKALEQAITSTIEATSTCYMKPTQTIDSKEKVTENQQRKDVDPSSTKSNEHLQIENRISVGTNTNWIPDKVNSATSPIKCIENIENNHRESSPDFEIQNILKEMISTIKPLSPLPTTPLNLRRIRKKPPVRVLYISKETQKLQLENYKLSKLLCRQKKQLISANKILLKNCKLRNSFRSVDEDKLVKLMMKFNNKFQLVEREHPELTNCNSSQTGVQKEKCTKTIKLKHKRKIIHDEGYQNESKAEKIAKVHNKQQVNVLELFGGDTSDIEDSTNNTDLSSKTSAPSRDEATVNSSTNHRQIIIAETIDANVIPVMENRETHVQNVRLKRKGKPSKLEKLKKKLAPKLKISSEVRVLRSERKGEKILDIHRPNRRQLLVTAVDGDKHLPLSEKSSKDMNNKEAYNKAVKIMTELKASGRKSDENCRAIQNIHKFTIKKNAIQNTDMNNKNKEGLNVPLIGKMSGIENAKDKIKSEVVICLQRLPLDTIQHDAAIFTFAAIKNSSYENTCSITDEDQACSKKNSSEINIIKSNAFSGTIENTSCNELKTKVTLATNIVEKLSITSSKFNSKTSQELSNLNSNLEHMKYEKSPVKKRKLSDPQTTLGDKITNKKSPKICSDKQTSPSKSYCNLDEVKIPLEKCVYKISNINYNDIDCDQNNVQLSNSRNNKDEIAYRITSDDDDESKPKANTKLKSLNESTNIRTLRSHVRSTSDSDNHNLPVEVTNRILKTRKSSSNSELRTEKEQASLNKIEPKVRSETTTTLKIEASTSQQYKESKLLNEDVITPIQNICSTSESTKYGINSIPEIISYEDMNMFASSENCVKDQTKLLLVELNTREQTAKKENVYFKSMLSKYGRRNTRNTAPVSFPDVPISDIRNMLEIKLCGIFEVPTAADLDDLVSQLEKVHHKHFIVALVGFLMAPNRYNDILCKTNTLRIPPMTKPEQALLFVLHKLQKKWPTVKLFLEIMRYIEFKLLRLSYSPSRNQVENLARFYAVICRFLRSRDLLRTFMVEAMYCMNYKAIPLIKQCLDVWMHAIPLAHLAEANTPIVQVLIHAIFYFRTEHNKSCDEVNALKLILSNKYSYDMKKFSEQDILKYLKNYISNIKDNTTQQKALSTAFILIAKRKGVQWCQKHIVEVMLMPLIKEKTTSERTKAFCISLLGSLLKPYPEDMKLHCEMTLNQLLLLMAETPSFAVEQAIMVTLILLRQHNTLRVMKTLTRWTPRGEVSSELQEQIKIMIQEIPLHVWINFLCGKKHV